MIYAVAALSDSAELPDSILRLDLPTYREYEPRVWFVVYDGTASELTDIIWPDHGRNYTIPYGIVLPVRSSNGFASGRLWEWIEMHS